VEKTSTRIGLWIWTTGVVLFLHIPIVIIVLYAFNDSSVQGWPITDWTTKWFGPTIHNGEMQQALLLSLKAGALATGIAMVLGSLAAFALYRASFFGRTMVSFLFVLPIALPGIITGMALNSYFTFWSTTFGLWTIVIGHATFCVVVVYNNVVARLRRTSGSFEEASADLGADTWQTFRWVTFPSLRSALGAGALLAFALSFDEIIVTTFTIGAGEETVPIWIFRNLFRPNQLPIVDAVAVLLILLSIIPVYLAHRLSSDEGLSRSGGGAAPAPPAIAEAEATAAH
jgi:putative spermidine/putrescine transport system permease protein